MKSCPFIRVENDETGLLSTTIYVPPPSSVMGGMARRAWLIKYFKENVFIASRERWNDLQQNPQLQVKYLVEEDGRYREEEEPPRLSK